MKPTLLIGLDGATFSILDSLMENGTMPFLKQFVSRGVKAKLLSTSHPLTPPAFTSIATGRSPGNHGIFDFIRGKERDGELFFTLYDSRDIRCETIWSIANHQNKRVTLLNFIMTSPVKPLNGYVIPGMVHWRHIRRNVYPPELYEKIQSLPGFDAKKLAWDFRRVEKALLLIPGEEYQDWVTYHIQREKQWFDITQYLMKKDLTDLVTVVFDGVDKIQHICWEFIDQKPSSAHSSKWEIDTRKLALEYFRKLDGFLKEIIELAGPEARIFIISDHGFGPTYVRFHVNQLLANLGYLKWKENTVDIKEKFPQDEEIVDLDWSHTVAYARTRSNNGVYIRIAQKDGQCGIPLQQYHSFREKLANQLLAFKDPATGKQIVKKVLRREEAFPGLVMNDAPDLTLILYDYGLISIAKREEVVEQREHVGGSHYPEGIFIAAGSGIQQKRDVGQLSILDIAPTVLYSLGLPIPENFEGTLPLSVFEERYLKENPVLKASPTKEVGKFGRGKEEEVYTEEEKKNIYTHLKALGYID